MNPKYDIFYLTLATHDLKNILNYISAYEDENTFLNLIEKAILNLSDFPMMGSTISKKYDIADNYRYINVGDYVIYYVVYEDDQIVEIRRILHQKQNADKKL